MANCRSCGAEIVWFAAEKTGARVPLNAEPEKRFIVTENELGQATARVVNTYLSHFATCPNADQHRKPKVQPA